MCTHGEGNPKVVAKVARAQAKATDGVRGCLVQIPMAAILMMVSIRMFFPAMVPFPAVVPMSLAMMVPRPAVVPMSVTIVKLILMHSTLIPEGNTVATLILFLGWMVMLQWTRSLVKRVCR